MKKITYTLLALLVLAGCQEDEWSGNSKQKQEIRVTANIPVTRTFFTEEGNVTHVSWEQGDEIRIDTKELSQMNYRAKEGGRETTFDYYWGDRLQAAEGDSVFACYPYDSSDMPWISNNYQVYNSTKDFLYAASVVKEGKVNLQFKHLFAFLKLTIPNSLLPDRGNDERIIIESSEKISLRGQFDLQKGDTVLTEAENVIDYVIPESIQTEELTCYIAILPQSAEAELKIHYLQDCLLTKKAPAGGFKAGNVYTLYLNENESEAIRQKEREALIAFYKATNGDNWTNNENWCSDKPVTEWYGVYAPLGRVWDISLYNNNLDGTGFEGMALSLLCDCEELRSIFLGLDNISGSIPAEIGNLKELRSIFLERCELSGKLPSEFTNLSHLSCLDLSYNQLEGEFPDLTFITPSSDRFQLIINDNKFSGDLPDISDSEEFNLMMYYAQNNQFTGSIPPNHARQMYRLTDWYDEDRVHKYCYYNVTNNNLSGKLPDEITQNENFHVYWTEILSQNTGYGFDRVDIPAHANTVKCLDGSFINLEEEYKKNEYTVLFRWDPYCPYSVPYPRKFEQLRQKYQEKGLGVLGMTLLKYSDEEMQPFTTEMPETKVFWEVSAENGAGMENEYNNNPYSFSGTYMYLFRSGATPLFYVVDKQGNIVFYGSCMSWEATDGTIPQHHSNRDDIFNFVANLFGDEEFVPGEVETDYSHDGEVVTLQTATVGKGIDLVFLGDGFTDKQMESEGVYEQKMKEAMEQFFDIEPYRTFRDRFNCYAVKVVTPNDKGSRINEDDNVCFEYAQKVPNINTDRWHISVIYSYNNGQRSYTTMYTDGTFVGYMFEGISNTLNHEVGGHGFAKLLDEYVEDGYENETLPEEGKESLDLQWTWGWGANVDWRNDPATVKWAHFLGDSRYANEGLGIYEGAYLYGYGAYRPTENSIMRYHYLDSGKAFNAPSREQIYKRIMQESEGEGWTYDYEEFVKIDEANRNAATTRALQTEPSPAAKREWQKRHRPPVIIKGTWRDAVKKQKNGSIVVPLR